MTGSGSGADKDASRLIRRVVSKELCSGCGACAALDPKISMQLNADGYLRPFAPEDQTLSLQADEFRMICPGLGLTAPMKSQSQDPVFGRYVTVWAGYATDPGTRFSGASGGVLTALERWLLETGRSSSVVGARSQATNPLITEPARVETSDGVTELAGSRYAPVAVASVFKAQGDTTAWCGKPCEVAAISSMERIGGAEHGSIKLSFFCAGVPSQDATAEFAKQVASTPVEMRYRGQGWPGNMYVRDDEGTEYQERYIDAWHTRLGPTTQWRCKLCVDGTGEWADIAAGDYWIRDDAGQPTFEEAEGESVVIARTQRGDALLREAIADGVLTLRPIEMSGLAQIQRHQFIRRVSLGARLFTAGLLGKGVPHYSGFGILRSTLRNPAQNVKAGVGTFWRLTFKRLRSR